MHKTPTRHKARTHKTTHTAKKQNNTTDLEKIKAYLWDNTHQLTASAAKATEGVQDYLGERPIKSVGVSLFTGIVTGICLGYYFRKNGSSLRNSTIKFLRK